MPPDPVIRRSDVPERRQEGSTMSPAARPLTPPHVLVILENVPLGTDRRVGKEVRELLRGGYRVSVVTQSAPENAGCRGWPGLTLLEYPAPPEPRSLLGYVREYTVSFTWACLHSGRARWRGRIDVLHLVQPPDIYIPLARLHKLFGAAILVDQHDLMPELLSIRQSSAVRPMSAVLRWLERLTQRVADETICTNDYQRKRLIGAGGAPERVTVVRNGPVLDRVRAATPDPSLKGDATYLCCWVGQMGRQDRLDLALHTVHHLVRELGRRDVRFVFLGAGECFGETRALAADLGLDPWVSFPGWVPETTVFAYLATADVGMDASLQQDVSPVKVFEYMAFGVPFVSFDLLETRTVGAGAGAYAPPDDVPALARELDLLLSDPERRARMGRVGQARVRDDLAWEHQGKKYLEVVDRLSTIARHRSRTDAASSSRVRRSWPRGTPPGVGYSGPETARSPRVVSRGRR
jgi:glycosyltransferase involved in cell wall biosynthesis